MRFGTNATEWTGVEGKRDVGVELGGHGRGMSGYWMTGYPCGTLQRVGGPMVDVREEKGGTCPDRIDLGMDLPGEP